VFDALTARAVPQRVLDAGFAWRMAVQEEGGGGPSAAAALERLAFELDEAVQAKADAKGAVCLVVEGALWSAEGEVR